MIDKLGKSVSASATMYGFYNVGSYIYSDAFTNEIGYYFIGAGLIFSLVWTFYIMGSFTDSLNRSALLRYGFVPAFAWVLNAPAVFDVYMNTVVDREYISTKQQYNKNIEPINEKLTIYREKLEQEQNINLEEKKTQQDKYDKFVNNKSKFMKEKEGLYIWERKGYKKANWKQKQNHDYRKAFTICDQNGYSIPNDNTAPYNIAVCQYNMQLKDLEPKTSSDTKTIELLISSLKQQKDELKLNYKRIEDKTFLNVYYFYFIMFLFGYFMEIKFANASFWIKWESKHGLNRDLKKQEEKATIAKNEHLYSTYTAVKNSDRLSLIEATFNAIIRTSYEENITLDNMTHKIVQRNMLDISPRTGRPFVAKKYQKKIRDLLKNSGFEQKKNKHSWLESVKSDIINSNTLR